MGLLLVAIRNPRWFRDCYRAVMGLLRGEHNIESFENELKLAARKHNVDYHKFSE